MIKLTIWRRLNPSLAFLILLLAIAALLAWGVEHYVAGNNRRIRPVVRVGFGNSFPA